MRSSLFIKTSLKLFFVYILSLLFILIVDFFPSYRLQMLICSTLVTFILELLVIWGTILMPLRDLISALKPIDFELDTINFTKLDNFKYKYKNDEIAFLIDKFKELSDVLVVRVDRVNTETYKSEHDGLSGLFNRVKYQRTKDIYAGCDNICIIYIDVNNLKKMNDIFGHEEGDRLIRKAAEKLKYWNGLGDCYRMGGDEFMVVLMDMSVNECKVLINNWYSTVGCLNNYEENGFKCLIAYGVAFGSKFCDIDALVKEADEKMYHHKVQIKIANGEDPNSR